MTVAFIDADSLKQVNDILGHKQGDLYLLDIVEIINKGIREDDILGRIGGDEFLLICPQTSRDDFSVMMERIDKRDEPFQRRIVPVLQDFLQHGFRGSGRQRRHVC